LAPLFALFTATAAQNKVQGMAVMKAASVVNLPPLLAYFVQGPAQWAFGLVPTFWPVKVFWLLQEGDAWGWAALAVGFAYQALLLAWMVRRYNAVMRRG
jgi:fluoroquinolone transport system permease protein